MATLPETGTEPVAKDSGAAPELDLLLHWPERHSTRGWVGIGAISVLLNLLCVAVVVQAPVATTPAQPERKVVVVKTRLYMPRDLLTQKAPNRRAVSKSIDLNDLLAVQAARPRPAVPTPAPRHFEAPRVSPPPQAQKTAPQITAAAPDITVNPPAAGNLPPGTPNGLTVKAAPPPTPPDQPFQNVGSEPLTNHAKIAVPKATVQGALQSLTPPSSGRLSVNDDNQSRPSIPSPGVAARDATQHAAIELQSDPQGADFRAYLASVLAIVRANWRQVIPESVHMGTLRGRTVVEFIISRDGSIPKLVTADSSGSDALDRAAVAGLSMSNPLPPLPVDFKGGQVRLAFTFSYNMPSSH